jgi:hypothetical protein
MANIEWQAYYFASLYASSPSARTEPREGEGEDDAASTAGARMDICKPLDTTAAIAETPGHCPILARRDVLKTAALH